MRRNKFKRMKKNSDLRQIYQLLLNYIKERSEKKHRILPIDIEIRFIDSVKLFWESGWVIEEHDFYETLNTLDIINHYEDQLFYLLLYFVDILKFNRDKLLEYFNNQTNISLKSNFMNHTDKNKNVDTKMVERRLKKLNRIVSEPRIKNTKNLFPLLN